MITINTTPPETFFAGNPVLFGIHSDNMLSYIGRKCQFKLVVSAADTAAGHTLVFTFPGKVITFTTAAVPDDSGLQIPTATNAALWSTWAISLYDCIQANYDISSKYSVILDTAGTSNRVIEFFAYKIGTADSASVVSHLVTATVFNYYNGLDSIPRNTFSIVGGIWDINMKLLAQDIKPVDASGNVTFNFSEYLSVLLETNLVPRFSWPFSTTILYRKFKNYILQFYAGFAERYDNTIRKIHFDLPRNAVPGGLNRETIVAYNTAGQNFFSVTENVLSFMTWAPLEKMTSKTCPELLFFHVPAKANYDQLNFVVIVTFTDNTTSTFITSIEDVSQNDVIELTVGYEKLALATRYPTKTVYSWQVMLSNQDAQMDTERRVFILDNTFYQNERVFLFQNSFARAYDIIRLTGRGSVDIEVEFSTSSSETIGDYTALNAPVSKFGTSEVQRLKVNSGWLTRELKDFMRELLLSRQVFEYTENGLFPVIITNDKMKSFFQDNDYLFDIEIDYDRAYRDFFFQSS